MEEEYLIASSILILSFLYAGVGHGGASGYIAIFSLTAVTPLAYKPVVLLLNILVSAVACVQFSKAGYFKWKLTVPFLIGSVPMAYLGANIQLDTKYYNLILGLALLFPIFKLLDMHPKVKSSISTAPYFVSLLIGSVLGLISGLLHIGGGIFLSPILILMGWATAKESAASSSFFILFNSLAGILSINNFGALGSYFGLIWILCALSGGIVGAYMGSHIYNNQIIRYILASVMSIACVKLLFF